MSDNCQNNSGSRQCSKRLSFQQQIPLDPNLYRSDDDDDDDEDEEELTDEDFFMEYAPICDTCHSCHLIGEIEDEDDGRELVDEDFYEVQPEYDEMYPAYPTNMNSRYGYYGGNTGCPPSPYRNMGGNYLPDSFGQCGCVATKPCLRDPPCEDNKYLAENTDSSKPPETLPESSVTKSKSLISCDDNTCGDKDKVAKRLNNESKPPEDSKNQAEPPKTEEKAFDESSEENINMLSVLVGTVMLLSADVTDIPEKDKDSSVKYLDYIKDTQGQRPPNVKKILRMLGVTDEQSPDTITTP